MSVGLLTTGGIALASAMAIAVYAGGLLVVTPVRPIAARIACRAALPASPRPSSDARLASARLDRLQLEVMSAHQAYRQSNSSAARGALQQALQARKDLLLASLREDPESAQFWLLAKPERAQLQQISEHCLEQETVVEGTLEVIHADDFLNRSGQFSYTLVTPDRQRISLHPVRGRHFPRLSGTRVRITGYVLDHELLFDGTGDAEERQSALGGITVLELPKNPPVHGGQPILTLLVDFPDARETRLTSEMVQTALFAHAFNFYHENSYGKITDFSGDVVGWRTLPIPKTCYGDQVLRESVKLLDAEIDFREYRRLIVVAPTNFESGGRCIASGIGTIDTIAVETQDGVVPLSVAWITASIDSVNFARTMEHELGHNFGNGHANFYDCGDDAYREAGCEAIEYGDLYDVMGVALSGHLNALHKEIPEWLGAENVQTVTQSGSYRIAPIEVATLEPQVIKIQRTPVDYLYAEYRQPLGYDRLFATTLVGTDVFTGALLHSTAVDHFSDTSWLIDPTPPASPLTSAFKVGDTFVDPLTGARVTGVARDDASMTIEVTVGKTDFTPPAVTIVEPVQDSLLVSGEVTVQADITDASGVGDVEVKVIGIFAEEMSLPLTAPPYRATLDTRLWGNGMNLIVVSAYDRSGEAHAVRNNYDSASRLVYVRNRDSVPPEVHLIAPGVEATQRNPVLLAAGASDDVDVYRVDFFANDALVLSDYTAPFEGEVHLPAGEYRLTAHAYDNVRNEAVSPESVLVRVINDPPTVTILQPVSGAAVADEVALVAQAEDDSLVQRVEFYLDRQSEPYTFGESTNGSIFRATVYSPNLTDGPHTIWARAYDGAGLWADSQPITVFVDNRPVTIRIDQPLEGATVTGAVEVSASSAGAIAYVEFYYRDSVSRLLALDTTSPYSTTWDTTQLLDGEYTVFALAFGSRGILERSNDVRVVVNHAAFIRGDANGDRVVDLSDAVRLLDFMFRGIGEVACLDAGDANDDGELDISDVITILLYLSDQVQVPTLPQPFPSAGSDPTADRFDCRP